ncbi:MAG: hypothetical protein R3240_07805, partial [Gammaproteobacteria bacterium]|nr:hypothetical protein [Gammaproteobacteria bacterium]
WDPSNTLVESKACANVCSLEIQQTLTLSGTYRILVSDSGLNEVGLYQLEINNLPAGTSPDPLQYNVPVQDGINHNTDNDFFEFQGAAASRVRINVSAVWNNMDPVMEIWDQNGVRLDSVACANVCSILKDYDLLDTGTYYINIRDSGLNEGGTYEINIQCVWGDCPTNTPAKKDYVDIALLPDISGDGIQEVAALFTKYNNTALPFITIKNGQNSNTISSFRILNANWAAERIVVIPDVNGNGYVEIAVLATNKENGAVIVYVLDSDTQEQISRFQIFNSKWNAVSIEAVDDRNGNGVSEVAVLAKHKSGGPVIVRMKDASTGDLIKNIKLK